MKRCPECRRDYYDDSLLYCLDDGTPLLEGPASGGGTGEEPPTAILSGPHSPSKGPDTGFTEAATRPQINTTADTLSGSTASRNKVLTLGILALLAVVGVGFAVYKYSGARTASVFTSTQNLKFTKLTSGSVWDAAISPDGKYVAYSTLAGDKATIRLRQVASTTDVEIVPPAGGGFMGLSFTPDSNYLYYSHFDSAAGGQDALYRIPALGGSPIKLADKMLYQDIAASPDGKTLAYIGVDVGKKESYLFLAKADGSDERTLIRLVEPSSLDRGLAWSPDGKELAVSLVADAEGKRVRKLFAVNVDDGSERQLSDQNWDRLNSVVWLADGSLLVSGNSGATGTEIGSPNQLWMVSPGATPQRITNDLNGYSNVSVTAKGDVLLATTAKRISSIWVAPESDAKRAVEVPNSGDVQLVNWTRDDRLLYASRGRDIWTMNADGTDQKQLTSDQGTNLHPSMTSDGRYIVFMSNRTSGIFHIFRMDADGRNQKQLTDGIGEGFPHLSADGKTVYYLSDAANNVDGGIFKIPIDGGDAVAIAKVSGDLRPFDVSPLDGKIAYREAEKGEDKTSGKIAIISSNGGDILRKLQIPPSAQAIFRFTPDGRAIAFQDSRSGGANLWAIDIDGKGESKPMTDFKGEAMDFSFAWSHDGKQLAVIRYNRVTDTVLITEGK
jgi:Tol biopolymer transport system component